MNNNNQPISRKKAAIILIVAMVLFMGFIYLLNIFFQSDENKFGKFIKIQNYSSKVKNLSGETREAIESTLYNTVEKNVDTTTIEPSKIKDAYIRDNSNKQEYNAQSTVYSGTFIVDMESIKQSYRVTYKYSHRNTADTGGTPISITCLAPNELIYGDFNCQDIISAQSNDYDEVTSVIPYHGLSFALTPDATQAGRGLVINARLIIPEIDLSGDKASQLAVIEQYKNEVRKWLESKGINPDDYEIDYNYDKDGNLIDNTPVVTGD